MATVLEKDVLALADATGVVIDRTQSPEKVIGQAWMISKSRAACLASRVSHYSEAPWALVVHFPHPDVKLAVKSVWFHPDFNRRAVREHYLKQNSELIVRQAAFDNDIATLSLESEIPELQPDKVQELNRALSMPLSIAAQDLSGAMKAGEVGSILQKALMSGRNGVLSFFDDRKIPFARVSIRGGRVIQAVFAGLVNEFAVCELMWRRPAGNFVLQADDFSWTNIAYIEMPTDQLAAEAVRRSNELPRLLDSIGGPTACLARNRSSLDVSQISAQNRPVAEKLWQAADGYLPVTKLAEKLGVDSFTAVQTAYEMRHLGLINSVAGGQFQRSGQLGAPMTPGSDLDLTVWEPVQGFYLDEHSGAPCLASGNFFGPASLLSPKALLHTVPLTGAAHGAAIIKDGRLVGVHSGKFISPTPQHLPPLPLSQMMWAGALGDTGTRRLRAHVEEGDELEISGRGTLSGMQRSRAGASELDELPLPSETEPKSTEPEILQKYTKVQILGAGGGMFVLGLLMALNSMLSPKPAAVPQAGGPSPPGSHSAAPTKQLAPDSPEAVAAAAQVAQQYAGFRAEAFAPFAYESGAALTSPKPSFVLNSPHTKILFVLWPQGEPEKVLKNIYPHLPFLDYKLNPDMKKPVDVGQDGELVWKLGNYRYMAKKEKDKEERAYDLRVLLGGFPSREPGQSIIFLARSPSEEGTFDYKGALSVIGRMRTSPGAADAEPAGTESAGGEEPAQMASPAEVSAYCASVGQALKSNYKPPADYMKANRAVVLFAISEDGTVRKYELKESSAVDSVDKSIQKLVQSQVPFPKPPRTKSGQIELLVTVEDGELTVQEQ